MGITSRAKARLRGIRRVLAQTKDPNFVGFDKYRRHGAYHWESLGSSEEYRAKVELLAARVSPSDRCLDLGCGDGAFAYALAGRCREIVGLDADFDAIECAEESLAMAGVTNVRCMRASLGSAPTLGLGQFDLVYSMDVLEHLPRPEELFEIALQMARPGGVIAIGTPLYIRDDLISEYHVTEYTIDQLQKMFADHLPLAEEVVLPGKRKDGMTYQSDFWTGFGTVSSPPASARG